MGGTPGIIGFSRMVPLPRSTFHRPYEDAFIRIDVTAPYFVDFIPGGEERLHHLRIELGARIPANILSVSLPAFSTGAADEFLCLVERRPHIGEDVFRVRERQPDIVPRAVVENFMVTGKSVRDTLTVADPV